VRTLVILIGGFVLLAVFVGAARIGAASTRGALIAFGVVWFLVAAGNMAMGVLKAGYAFTEELPIFLLIFLVPVAAALLLRWKLA
jgi:hypothetical protein